MKIVYENAEFALHEGGLIVDKATNVMVGTITSGGIDWSQPSDQTKLAASAFVGEVAMEGIEVLSGGMEE
ncbi:MAG: hypothetical protein VB042_08820 [Victivallaceae bacterium]|nr:hypothetical protein [Victivallaceae bacterium]